MPPDVREWLPADHLAWFVIDAAADMELSAFDAAYRSDGHGRAAYEPSLMVALVLYAFATNVRSSRAIERHCRQHVAYRVITGNLIPDHATIAAVHLPARGGAGRTVHRGAEAVRPRRAGGAWGGVDRRHQDRG